ncbi:hypothetical protein DSCO28_15230 [Desulfosarcina ovata subsp. sediminis]|uniref:Uncharacterized protein n=1 Tax=Desulfosarcina ovata subsp. sediminis TaxID=885957 RepID=A0A5K7ZLQ0_9BACT|nr:hypothetical protein [Desulfosarcina ovata]BBO80957.1 hypothetical protein DSCO28_15230 [Desulfosarcina ovata subsp. sediminis]
MADGFRWFWWELESLELDGNYIGGHRLVENGLKDLVYSYFLDEMTGSDPEKVEFELYCIMVARLAYENGSSRISVNFPYDQGHRYFFPLILQQKLKPNVWFSH